MWGAPKTNNSKSNLGFFITINLHTPSNSKQTITPSSSRSLSPATENTTTESQGTTAVTRSHPNNSNSKYYVWSPLATSATTKTYKNHHYRRSISITNYKE